MLVLVSERQQQDASNSIDLDNVTLHARTALQLVRTLPLQLLQSYI
jgi:hypothetical protein